MFLTKTGETGDKNCDVTANIQKFSRAPYMFCEESFGEINAKDVKLFQNGSVREFYHLKALISLEQVKISVVKKGEESL